MKSLETPAWTRFDRFALGAVGLAVSLVFFYLSAFCLLNTYIFDPKDRFVEHMLRVADPVWLNLCVVLCILFALRLFLRLEKRLSLRFCTGIFLALVFGLGALWSLSLDFFCRADSRACYNAGINFAQGLPFNQLGYFRNYPYQIGYTLYCELFIRIFGDSCAPQIGAFNALFLALAYGAILSLLWKSQRNKRLQLCAMAMLGLCLQPILYSTFIYGTLPGLCFALWAVFFAYLWMKNGRAWHLLLSALLCALAIVLKQNHWITALALFLLLGLFCLSARRFRQLPLVLALLVLPVLATSSLQAAFEARIGQKLGKGTPLVAWMAMGLQEGSRAAGWYNSYTVQALARANYDPAMAEAQCWEDVQDRLKVFAADPAYALSFAHNKMVSQWGETTFESLWLNYNLKFQSPPPAFQKSVMQGPAAPYVERYMDGYSILLFGSFALGALLLVVGKGARGRNWASAFPMAAFVMVVFGGFLYHMLFEASSEYLFIYLPLMAPVGAWVLARPLRFRGAASGKEGLSAK